MGNEMLFGIYHTDCRKNVERFKQLVSSDFINTFLIEGDIDDEYFSMNFELSKEYPKRISGSVWENSGFIMRR